MDALEFWTICNSNGILFSREQIESFERYHDELLYWNEKVNLISRKDMDNIWVRHFMHSLSIVKADIIPPKAICMDVGTGGGFPGIPTGIARPDCPLTLVDSIAKKMKLTGMFAQHTGQRNFRTLVSRMEELAGDPRHKSQYDIIMARAVAPVSKLIGWTRPLLKKNGKWAFLKGGDLEQEIQEAVQLFPGLNISVQQISWSGTDWFTLEQKKLLICTFNS
jgi:16S rRNA (guanine527-N7)-methyltransferase